MLDLKHLARLEEARIAEGVASVAEEARPFAGGTISRGKPGTWCNFICGAGLDGPMTADELDLAESFYIEKGLEPRIELSPYAHPEFLAQLESRNWTIRGFETVFFRTIAPNEPFASLHTPPPSLRITVVPKDDQALLHEFAWTSVSGFLPDGRNPTEDELALAKRAATHYRSHAFLATVNDKPASAGSCEVAHTPHGSIAALFGLSTLPPFRRMGIQQALIAARLAFARDHGATVATIGGLPGAGTERNVRRMGFQVAYTKAIMVKPGPNLVRIPGM
ncbi:MAG TPA: GNAT family N-acetyltransferase [Phycisphaerales bacterium]|nr:GNAT family N-acetyltransferase [Phycisphaerales bacterium]